MMTMPAVPAPRSEGLAPALRAPEVKNEKDWAAKAERAREARRLGAELRRGRRKSFHPVVGRI